VSPCEGEGEAVCGAEAHPGPAARPGGSRAAAAVPVDPQRENQEAKGHLKPPFLASQTYSTSHFLFYFMFFVVVIHYFSYF